MTGLILRIANRHCAEVRSFDIGRFLDAAAATAEREQVAQRNCQPASPSAWKRNKRSRYAVVFHLFAHRRVPFQVTANSISWKRHKSTASSIARPTTNAATAYSSPIDFLGKRQSPKSADFPRASVEDVFGDVDSVSSNVPSVHPQDQAASRLYWVLLLSTLHATHCLPRLQALS